MLDWCGLVVSRALAAGLRHGLQFQGCLVELDRSRTYDCGRPIAGDLLPGWSRTSLNPEVMKELVSMCAPPVCVYISPVLYR